MYGEGGPGRGPADVFYYLTVYNEPVQQPAKPSAAGIDEGILKGLYRFNTAESAGLTPAANAARIPSCSAPVRRSTGR
ncbi:pyruvate dehydrogenase (acetyl-transferring), homodimeric type [Streptomyces hirsutus]